MKVIAPVIILVSLALVTLFFTFRGENSYPSLISLRQGMKSQQERNSALQGKVDSLRREVLSLQHDKRALERAARNELGLARPDEKIFIFKKADPTQPH